MRNVPNLTVTQQTFRDEVLPGGQPVVLRDAVAHWPSVRAARESDQAVTDYLLGFDRGTDAETMLGDPSIRGRFFYDDTLTRLNFERRRLPLAQSLRKLLELRDVPEPPAVYVGAMPMPEGLPGFARDNVLDLVDSRVAPRLWLSNRVTVQTHYDLSFNVACVVAGRRRFTLFPPEQMVNLYVGPLEFTLAGQPISMVRLDQPDLQRFPRFEEARKHAMVAELGPGDALFIPYMWWHHVESLDAFNVLVNYWWDDTPGWLGSPFEALLHSLMSVKTLPPERRELWRKVFEHHVFETHGDPVAHLPPDRRGVQGEVDLRTALGLRQWLIKVLTPPRPR